jgi:hypothetical protein
MKGQAGDVQRPGRAEDVLQIGDRQNNCEGIAYRDTEPFGITRRSTVFV